MLRFFRQGVGTFLAPWFSFPLSHLNVTKFSHLNNLLIKVLLSIKHIPSTQWHPDKSHQFTFSQANI